MSNAESPSVIIIEPATAVDVDEIVRIEEACFSAPWTRKMLEAELVGNQFSSFFVAKQAADHASVGTRLAGYVCFWVVFEELRIMNVAVIPSARRQGIARRLIDRALDIGREKSAVKGLLEVRASNSAARRLYGALGFREASIRTNYYTHPTEDAILMEMGSLQRPPAPAGSISSASLEEVQPRLTLSTEEVRHDDGTCHRRAVTPIQH
jgi:ribosomal-protein-alanine N-acetyltransferase